MLVLVCREQIMIPNKLRCRNEGSGTFVTVLLCHGPTRSGSVEERVKMRVMEGGGEMWFVVVDPTLSVLLALTASVYPFQ